MSVRPAAYAAQLTARGRYRRSGDVPDPFVMQDQLNRLQMDLQHVQTVLQRMRAKNARQRGGYRVIGDGASWPGDDAHEQDLMALQGWLISAVESFLTMVLLDYGRDELNQTVAVWKRMF